MLETLHPGADPILPKIRWHWQNLNEDRAGNLVGSGLKRGRAWLYIGKATFGFEWAFWSSFCHAYMKIGGSEHDLSFSLAFPPVAFWFQVGRLFPGKLQELFLYAKEIGISIRDRTIWFDFWSDEGYWRASDPWWKRGLSFAPLDFFLGKSKYSSRDLKRCRVVVPMPEKNYEATVRIFESTWKRPRWPFPEKMVRAEIIPDEPIPEPGKGTASWNCGEDACHSMTCPAKTPGEAVAELVKSVLQIREKRGGLNWRSKKDRKE